jgi:hypothetical protein
MARLPPPHRTFDEIQAEKQRHLTIEEEARRARAISDAQQREQQDKLDRPLKMLRLATSAELRAKILSRLSSEEALQLAERVEDADLRDMLVLHSLEG